MGKGEGAGYVWVGGVGGRGWEVAASWLGASVASGAAGGCGWTRELLISSRSSRFSVWRAATDAVRASMLAWKSGVCSGAGWSCWSSIGRISPMALRNARQGGCRRAQIGIAKVLLQATGNGCRDLIWTIGLGNRSVDHTGFCDHMDCGWISITDS
jgi:hypothetical protein